MALPHPQTLVTRLPAVLAQAQTEMVINDRRAVFDTAEAIAQEDRHRPVAPAATPLPDLEATSSEVAGLPRILIIDDNDMNIQLATVVLSGADFNVASAADVNQGMRLIEDFKPDLILMDIQMPDMDGIELTLRLKAAESTRHIAVVAFTAYAVIGDEARFREAGFQGYIGKPFEVRTFADKVRSYLTLLGPR
jgi:CheY-like chemotaxis protein